MTVMPDIIGLGTSEHLQTWMDAVTRDRDAGLIPRWIGAVVVSVLPNGTASMAYIKRRVWAAVKSSFLKN